MPVRGIRGAVTVEEDTASKVVEATTVLLQTIQSQNGFEVEDIASVIFTATSDIKSVYPAVAARNLGWNRVPLLCLQEMTVSGSLPLCIRVLIMVNTNLSQYDIKPVYLEKARVLRPDLC
jgi:chorismate mutase